MPRKESEAVPKGVDPFSLQKFGPDQPMLADLYRLLKIRIQKGAKIK